MKLADHLRLENIFLNEKLPDKTAVLRFIADAAVQNGIVKDSGELLKGLIERENTMSTGVGGCLGFPHTTSMEAINAAVILIRLEKPIDFQSLDTHPVDIILALIIPQQNPEMHVRLLARVSRLCRSDRFLSAVKQADEPETLWHALNALEEQTGFYH